MVAGRALKAGNAFIEYFIRDSKFRASLRGIETRLKSSGRFITGIGARLAGAVAAAAAPLAASVITFIRAGDELDKMSARTGASVEALSALKFAASQSGAEFTAVEKGLLKMNKVLLDLDDGLLAVVKDFDSLGLSIDDFEGLGIVERLALIADGLMGVEDMGKRSGLALRVLGKAGAALLPLLSGGAEGIAEFRERAGQLGLLVSPEQAASAAKLTDSLDILKRVLGATSFNIGAALADPIRAVVDSLVLVAVKIVRFVGLNKELIQSFAGFLLAAAGVAAAITAFGLSLIIAGTLVGSVASLWGLLVGVIGTVATVLATVLSPIGLVIAAIAGLGGALIFNLGGAAGAVTIFADSWSRIFQIVKDTITNVGAALSAGDLPLALQIATAGLQEVWREGLSGLELAWLNTTVLLRQIWIDSNAAIAANMVNLWALLESGWTVSAASTVRIWDRLVAGISKTLLGLTPISQEDFLIGVQQIDQQFDQRQRDRTGQRNKRLFDIERDRQGTQGQLDADVARRRGEIEARANEDLDELQKRTNEARDRWEKANAEAAKAAAEAAEAQGDLPEEFQKIIDALEGAGAATAAAADRGPRGVLATSLASRIFGTGPESVQKQQLDVQKKILGEAEKQRKALEKKGQLQFG